jgi:hypothetical protein
MGQYFHLANAKGRDASVGLLTVPTPAVPRLGLPGVTLRFRRYVAAAEAGTHSALAARFGADYGQQLIDGDPEIDLERVGAYVEQTQRVHLDGDGQLLYVEPQVVEIVTHPDGSEKERREPVDAVANVNADSPIRWTGRKVPIATAVRRFAFRRRVQLQHVDGLTYDFLFEMARDLEASASVMLLGSGDKGTGPLLFQTNGRPYRGFLHGRTDGPRYQLVLLLSDMELKAPPTAAAGGNDA